MQKSCIFINGTFDLLHPGHLRLIDVVNTIGLPTAVSLTSDRLVEEQKGHKPVFSEAHRIGLVRRLLTTELLMVRDHDSEKELESTILDLYEDYSGGILHIKGSDYINKNITGSKYFSEILFISRDGFSSSELRGRVR